jgi:hypothetical protein
MTTTKTYRIRNLTTRCTEEIEDTFAEGVPADIIIGRTYVEASAEDLLDIADQLETKEAWVDHSSPNVALQEQSIKNAEDALIRWARKIRLDVEFKMGIESRKNSESAVER